MGITLKSTKNLLHAVLIYVFLSAGVLAQMPIKDGADHAPDSWLLQKDGWNWWYSVKPAPKTAELERRRPTNAERPIVERVEKLMETRPARAFALIDGNTVVHKEFNSPANRWSTFFGFSIGKTVTAMGVGQAICADKLELSTRAKEVIPQLTGKALGEAEVYDLLRMSSGTWRGFPDTTLWTPEHRAAWRQGELDISAVITSDRVTRAQRWGQRDLRPGDIFHYKSTDPQLLAMMTAKATGMPWAQWLQRMVFDKMGVEHRGIYEQDRLQNGEAGAGTRLRMDDWIRFADWVKRSSTEPGCFGDFVRSAFLTQIPTERRTNKHFAGYGYFVWTENDFAPNTVWAVGYGGQLMGWSTDPANRRMVIVFSSTETWSEDVFEVARDWMSVK